jgi:hypothetical protein
MGRTIPSWRIIVDQEIAVMSRFKQFLGPEDRAVFDDLVSQCKLYAAEAGLLASPVKEVPLLEGPPHSMNEKEGSVPATLLAHRSFRERS